MPHPLLFAVGLSASLLPETSTRAAAELRAAAEKLDAGAPGAALEALGSAPTGGFGDPLRGWLAAQAQAALGRDGRALAALGPPLESRCLDSEDDVPRQARTELAATLLAESDPDAAARRLAALETAAGWSRALALASGPFRDAMERRLLMEGAGTPEAKAHFERLGAKAALARFSRLTDKIELAEAWLRAHDNARAVALASLLAPEVASRPVARCRVGYVLGKAARKMRKYRRAQAQLNAAREGCFESASETEGAARDVLRDRAIRSALLQARVLAIRGRAGPIDGLVTWMKTHYPGHSYIDDAALWAAEEKRGAAARAALRATLALDGDQAPGAAWRLAFDAFLERRLDAARALLARIPEMRQADLDDRERAEHFLGLIEARTSTAAAAARWARLARRPSFYGFVALDRLREVNPARAEALEAGLRAATRGPEPGLSPRVAALPALEQAALWRRAGFPGWAEAELRAAACALEAPSRRDTLSLALALEAVGAHPAAQRLLRWDRRGLLRGPLTEKTAPFWRAAYSRAFTEEIRAAAEAEDLEPLLLTALAREESTFDPEIVSWAGATGLAQLMPPTAAEAWASVFGGRLDPEQLLDPALNLRLGAHVLKEGLRTFGGVEPLALSAYNGGAGLTERTLPSRVRRFEVWAEMNPVKENRGYVKRVTGTWGIYRLLYDPDHAGPRLPRTVGPGDAVRYRAR
jgi:soluble lytic murein transglycosylase